MSFGTTVRQRVRRAVPWWAKGTVKVALHTMHIDYRALRAFGLSQHGGMGNPTWAYKIFRSHFDRADAKCFSRGDGFTVLELGPGDSLFTALIARAHGAKETWLVDVGAFATRELARYRTMEQYLKDEQHLPVPGLSEADSLEDVLDACGARYEINGLSSLRTIPTASIDFVFSNAVLQAIPRGEVPETLRELRRILMPTGCAVHSVDLRDMMGQSLNHLRFSQRVWESKLIRGAGFYTNRLLLPELLDTCRAAGFATEAVEINRWTNLPLPKRKLASPYRERADEDLLPATVQLLLKPA